LETLHSAALLILVYEVLPSYDPLLGCLLLLNITAFPALLRLLEDLFSLRDASHRDPRKETFIRKVLRWLMDFLGLVAQVAALAIFVWRTHSFYENSTLTILVTVTFAVTSITWWPNFVKDVPKLYALKMQIRRHKVKIDFITSLWKIALSFLAVSVMFAVGGGDCAEVFYVRGKAVATGCSIFGNLTLIDSTSLNPSPLAACGRYLPFVLALINILSSGFCYVIGTAACQVRAQIPCFAVPLLLATPTTFAFIILAYSPDNVNSDVFGCLLPLPLVDDLSGMLKAYNQGMWLAVGFVSYAAYLLIGRHVFTHQITKLAQSYR
jgi:chitin synthase